MPELPEVETVKNQLNKYIVGHTIKDVIINNQKIFEGNAKDIVGGKINSVQRFGKVLVINLDNDYSVVSHIKLTGQFIYRGPNLLNPDNLSKKVTGGIGGIHTHVIFELDKNGFLYYNDVRRFGWIKIVKTQNVLEFPFIKKLGPEPFGKLDLETFKTIIQKTTRPIKVVLMDQEKIGGIGNIYANDALWDSKIHPSRKSNLLSNDESKNLYESILKVLQKGIDSGGASELAFVTPDGAEGQYQFHTLVYDETGKLCRRCKKEKIVKYALAGRGTYFCPNCQNEKI